MSFIETVLPAGTGVIAWLLRALGVSLSALLARPDSAVVRRLARCAAAAIAVAVAYHGIAARRAWKSHPLKTVTSPVPPGKIRICVAGRTHCAEAAFAHYLADAVAASAPTAIETSYHWSLLGPSASPSLRPAAPCVWLERADGLAADREMLGAPSRFAQWALDPANDVRAGGGAGAGATGAQVLAKGGWSWMDYGTGHAFHTTNGKGAAATAAQQ